LGGISCLNALAGFAGAIAGSGGLSALLGCFGAVVGLLLLAGGVKLLRRDPQARGLHLAYAGLQLLAVGIGAGVFARFFGPGIGRGQQAAIIWGVLVARLGIGAAYPVFLLVWFFRPSIRAEVESWPRWDEPEPGPAGRPWPYPPTPEEEQEPPEPLPSSGSERPRPPTHLG
jgi:hypothetical protein